MLTVIRHIRCPHYLFHMVLMVGLLCSNISLAQDRADKSTKILQSVNLEITSHLGDQQSFAEQDVISFFISLDQAAFVYAFYQDASGQVYQLIPGRAQPEHYFQPGFYIPFPPQNSSFQFVVQAPFGEEQIWIFASDQGQLVFAGQQSSQGIIRLTVGRSTLVDSIKAASSRLFDEASLTFHTRRR